MPKIDLQIRCGTVAGGSTGADRRAVDLAMADGRLEVLAPGRPV